MVRSILAKYCTSVNYGTGVHIDLVEQLIASHSRSNQDAWFPILSATTTHQIKYKIDSLWYIDEEILLDHAILLWILLYVLYDGLVLLVLKVRILPYDPCFKIPLTAHIWLLSHLNRATKLAFTSTNRFIIVKQVHELAFVRKRVSMIVVERVQGGLDILGVLIRKLTSI